MGSHTLQIGFVPLIDAAPLIAAERLGYFRDESLAVSLRRQIGWANIRDKLSYGYLDAGHALLGMPLTSYMGRDGFHEPLISMMALGAGGNAITVRKELYDLGVRSGPELAALIGRRGGFSGGRLIVGHVFSVSMHHYLLREWLASANIDPEKDVQLCVIPPPQMAEHMRGRYVDLFCVGEPWNTLAMREGYGTAIVATTDILPNHPEKILAVTRRFASTQRQLLAPLIRAVLRGCLWCDEAKNRPALAEMLARPEYLAQAESVMAESLSIDRNFGTQRQQKNARPAGWNFRSFAGGEVGGGAGASTFPNKMHAVWLMKEMMRWGHLHQDTDIASIADQCADTAPYREAAASLGVACPAEDFIPMEVRHGRLFTLDDLKAPLGADRGRGVPRAWMGRPKSLSEKGAHP